MRMPLIALLAIALLLPSCRKQVDYSQSTPARTSTTTTDIHKVPENMPRMNPVAPPQQELPGSRVAGAAGPEQQVDLVEYSIHMPSTLPAGPVTLRVSNAGKENHGLVVERDGVQVKLPNELTRGDSSSVALDLKPGTYTVWCPVDGHRGKGMQTTFTVAAHQ
jgi:hypothetical protein